MIEKKFVPEVIRLEAVIETKLSFETVEVDQNGAAAIIVAAGSSRRMQGQDKLFAGLCGVPVIVRTLRAFERSPQISKIILVTKEENINRMQLLAENYLITKLTDIVAGGKERSESVLRGMEALSKEDQYVLIHDGARPLVSEKMISEVLSAAKKYGAAACAVALKDTVKQVDADGFVSHTPDRSSLRAVQTPQGFSVSLYRESVPKDLSGFTDDCSVVEAAGHPVFLTEGSVRNLKITTPEDLLFAEAILKSGEENL